MPFLYVLSRDGKPDMGTIGLLRDRYKDELTVESKALLGGAYAGAGDASALEQLLKGINDVEEIARQTGGPQLDNKKQGNTADGVYSTSTPKTRGSRLSSTGCRGMRSSTGGGRRRKAHSHSSR
ncbi:MAG: hypothetical protein R3B51_09680 [Thermodesulfobacteriota bacterium]